MNTFTAIALSSVITLTAYSAAATQGMAQAVPVQEPQPIVISLSEKLQSADLTERRVLLRDEINKASLKHGTNSDQIYSTIAKCENKEIEPSLQSGHVYDFNSEKRGIVKGEREKSFGLAMIHLPDHPDISYDQATNPEFAIDWMASEFAAGRQNQWTCYRILFGAK